MSDKKIHKYKDLNSEMSDSKLILIKNPAICLIYWFLIAKIIPISSLIFLLFTENDVDSNFFIKPVNNLGYFSAK